MSSRKRDYGNLSPVEERAVLAAYVQRRRSREKRLATYQPTQRELDVARDLRATWFPQQAEFFNSAQRRRVAFTTRRGGKTIGTAIWHAASLLENPTSLHIYLAQTAGICKLYMWAELKKLIKEYDLPFKQSETDLTLTHVRGLGAIVLKGADKATEIEKLRGPKFIKVSLDESASFGPFMENLIMEVLGPTLLDYDGELIMTGTAGKKKEGIFYQACHELLRRKSDGRPVYELHRWSYKDNPYIPESSKDETRIIDENGFSGTDDPRFLREFCGIWAVGESERVFSGFSAERDLFDGQLPRKHEWHYILGLDFGWHDESAIVVVAYSPTCRRMYAVDCWSAKRQYSDDVAAQVTAFRNLYGQRAPCYGDLGGYGKGIAEHMLRDHGIHVEPAAKRDKLDHIAIVNSAFKRGDLQVDAQKCSGLISQLAQVAWNVSRTDMGNHERDDLCFAAGTLIETRRGAVPIELICEGDMVMTRKGWRSISNSGYAGRSRLLELGFDNRIALRCTPEHKFEIDGQEVHAWQLRTGDRLDGLTKWCGKAAFGAKARSAIIGALDGFCIGPNGSTIGDLFRQDGKFTTKIMTVAIIAWRTSRVCLAASIRRSILRMGVRGAENLQLSTEPTLARGYSAQEMCSHPRKKLRGQERLLSICQTHVSFVAQLCRHERPGKASKSALKSALLSNVVTAVSMTRTLCASFAKKYFGATGTIDRDSAITLAARQCKTVSALPGVHKVYRISVEGEHEYFANGVHTLNCASFLYGFRAAKTLGAGRKSLNANVEMDPGTAFAIKEKQDALRKRPQQKGEPAWLSAEPGDRDGAVKVRPSMWRDIVGL